MSSVSYLIPASIFFSLVIFFLAFFFGQILLSFFAGLAYEKVIVRPSYGRSRLHPVSLAFPFKSGVLRPAGKINNPSHPLRKVQTRFPLFSLGIFLMAPQIVTVLLFPI